MLDLCAIGSDSGQDCWTCLQQVQRVNRDVGLVCNRFRGWIGMLELCATGSESG